MLETDAPQQRLPFAPRLASLPERFRRHLPLFILGILLLLIALAFAPRPPEGSPSPAGGPEDLQRQTIQAPLLGALTPSPLAKAAIHGDTSTASAPASVPTNTSAASPATADLGATATRQITRSADLSLQVRNIGAAYHQLLSLTARFGGYAATAEWQRGTPAAEADLDLQIPANRLDTFLTAAGRLGDTVSSQENGQDVTDQSIDTGARLRVLKAEETRYIGFLGQAKTVDQMVQVEDPLAQVQQEIEELTGRERQLRAEVAMAAVHVSVWPMEVRAPRRPLPTLGAATSQAWAGSLGTVKYILERLYLALVWLLPFVPLGAVVYGAWRLFRRLRSR